MKIAIYADTHGLAGPVINKYKSETGYDIEDTNIEPVDLVCLLGDHSETDVKIIESHYPNTNIIGIYGNHDTLNLYENTRVTNIHKKIYNQNDYSFIGFQGSHKYKLSQIYGYTQEESIEECKYLPKVDILLSHDGPYGKYYKSINDAHCGLKGLFNYIKKNNPKIMFFGHHHTNMNFQIETKAWFSKAHITNCYCIYGCSVVTIENDTIIDIKNYSLD